MLDLPSIENESLLKHFSPQGPTTRLPAYDYGRPTKIMAYLGLAATWVLIACCTVFGVVCILKGPAISSTYLYWTGIDYITHEGVELVGLVVNTALTLSLDSLGYILGSSLRWTLAREGRLQHNTNLRLFRTARNQPQHSWIANVLDGFSLIICYAATSQLFASARLNQGPQSGVDLPSYGYYVNGIALLMLAAGLALKASIATWIVISTSHLILTWSSNPLNNALALLHNGLAHNDNRCMLSTAQEHLASTLR